MKKTIFFLAALVLGTMAASINAQTLSSSTVDVRYCFEDATEETVSELCNDSYLWVDASGRKETMTLTQSGDYTRTLINTRGCDSIVTLHLTLEDNRTYSSIDTTICLGEPLVFKNETIAASPTTGTYHAYSTNAASCEHDDILNVTVTPCYPVGAASGHVFSVAADKQVYFSKGNLVYKSSGTRTCNDNTQKNGTFSFAENQYTSGSLFAYGSSGFQIPPTATATSLGVTALTGTNNEWGVYNPITNGGNQPNQWRTLPNAEWKYIFSERSDAANKIGVGTVVNATGIILLPDDWGAAPAGCTFTPYSKDSKETRARDTNVYDADQWADMEAAGAVFLYGTLSTTTVGSSATYYYWYSTSYVLKLGLSNTSTWTYTLGQSTSGTGGASTMAYVRLVMDKPAE